MKFSLFSKPRVLGLALGLMASSAYADHCSVNFNYGVVIDPKHVRFLDHGQTKVQINGSHQLFIGGRQIELSTLQQKGLSQYTQGIRNQVPVIVSIAIEGVEIGLKAVNTVIGGLTGENSQTHQKFQEKFDDLHLRLRKRFNHSDQSYYIAPQDFNDFDEIFAGQFEQEIEEIISSSLGSILVAVGEAMTASEDQNSEARVDTFDDRIASLSQNLEFEVGDKAKALESRAAMFCDKLLELDKLEDNIQMNIPQLANFNLIDSGQDHDHYSQ